MAFGDYDFSLTAGQSVQLAVTGAFLRVRNATGKVRVSIDGGQGVTLQAGQGFKMPAGMSFRDVSVRDVSGQANAGVIFIGDAGFDDQTLFGAVSITGGNVSTKSEIIDSSKLSSSYSYGFGPLNLANLSTMRLCLVNPAASLKTVYVDSLIFGTPSQDTLKTVGSVNRILKIFAVTAYPAAVNIKSFGSTAMSSYAQAFFDFGNGVAGFTYVDQTDVHNCLPNGESEADGIILEPGQALIATFLNNDGVTRSLSLQAFWHEK